MARCIFLHVAQSAAGLRFVHQRNFLHPSLPSSVILLSIAFAISIVILDRPFLYCDYIIYLTLDNCNLNNEQSCVRQFVQSNGR
nr:MAG TPA: Protein Kinase superfamily protein [Caudoviricetes sp.]